MMDYDHFVRQLYRTGILSDPWIEGKRRFGLTPLRLESERLAEMYLVAERIAAVIEEMAGLIWQESDLLDRYFQLTPWQKMMWLASGGRWHGIARIDLFSCTDGRWQVCEVNSDTPSGEAEAIILNRIVGEESGPTLPEMIDPNAGFAERFRRMLLASTEAAIGAREGLPRIGLLYPTDQTEDLSLIALYRGWIESWGGEVVLGSPFNLGLQGAGREALVTLTGSPVDLLLRHYKTDWWGEREEIWQDQPTWPDPDPLERELSILLAAEHEGRVAVVNPFGSVVTQNKLSLAFMWDYRARFSAAAREWIENYIPETRRMVDIEPARLRREEWVLKSVYGCEGDSVIVGPFVSEEVWQRSLDKLIPRHWIAQRYFEVAPFSAEVAAEPEYGGWRPNYGIFVIAAEAAGIYTRLARQATDYTAVTIPTFVSHR